MSSPLSETARRTQILDAAERLVRHYGFQKTTVGDIAREAQVGVGTVYLEFTSKDAIVEELSVHRHARVLAAMRDAAGRKAAYERRFRDVMDARLLGFLKVMEDGQHAADLVHCVCPSVKQAHARFRAEEEALLTALFVSADATGEFLVKDPAATARLILAAYVSFSPPWVFTLSREDVQEQHGAMHALMLRGLLKR